MKAVAFLGEGKAGLIDYHLPVIEEKTTLIKITRSALCGSDMGPGLKNFLAERKEPAPIGHEAVGIVAESSSSKFPPGRRVAILVIRGCMTCAACAKGHYSLCEQTRSIFPVNAEYALVPEENLIPLPDDISYEQALLGFGCGLGVALGAVEKLDIQPDQPVAVLGLGPIGLSVIEVLRQRGASPMAIDVNQQRLQIARDLGAVRTFDPSMADGAAVIRKNVPQLRNLVFCSSSEQALETALRILAKNATLVLLGAPELKTVNTFRDIVARDLTLKGSWHYGLEHVPVILALLRAMRRPELVITHVFPVTACQQAYDLFRTGNCGKVLLNWEA